MNIVSYNIWNHDTNYDQRMNLLCDLLCKEQIDMLALQEVKSEDAVIKVKEKCGFKYSFWKKYHDCDEGLAILSNHEILSKWTNWDENIDVHNSGLMCVEVSFEGRRIGLSNVHLDYRYAFNREIEITKLTDYMGTLETTYNIMLGDFNTYPSSSIHGYLTGRQSLMGRSARWIDLAETFSSKNGKKPEMTIDFYNNPRWLNEKILDIPGRFDWILLENPYPNDYPSLQDYKLIGVEPIDGITPSDHYGVMCCIDFGHCRK